MSDKRVGDMKHGLTGDRPKMSLLGEDAATFQVRGTEYGADKYARGNYYGPAPEGVTPVDRFLGYIDATMRHLLAITKAINVARGTGGDQEAACGVVDDKASGGFPPSLLPHIAHAMASTAIGIECAVRDGILTADPGQPWKRHPLYAEVLARRGTKSGSGLPQKDDPDSERRRVASGYNAPSAPTLQDLVREAAEAFGEEEPTAEREVDLSAIEVAPLVERVRQWVRAATGVELPEQDAVSLVAVARDADVEGDWAVESKEGLGVEEILARYPGAAAAAMAALGGEENLLNLKAELSGLPRPHPDAYDRMHEAMQELDRKKLERDEKWLDEFATVRT